jgi:hypothetical protein
VGDPRRVRVNGGEQRGRRVGIHGAITFLDGRVRVDGGLAEPCIKRLWASTLAS